MDTREHKAENKVSWFREHGIESELAALPVGDFQVQGERGTRIVEVSTASDYLSKLASGRLVDQLLRLVGVKDAEPRLLVIGSFRLALKFRHWSETSIIGSIVSTTEAWHVPMVIIDKSWRNQYLLQLHKEMQPKEHDSYHRLVSATRNLPRYKQQRAIIEAMPGIGPKMAHKLLESFGSVAAVMTATYDQLRAIDGIGRKTATGIQTVIAEPYVVSK